MVARQQHGFDYEQYIIQKYNLHKTLKYTDPYDAYYNGIPIQIKCSKYGSSIEFGDYIRNKNKQENFILIIGFWKLHKRVNEVKENIFYIDYHKFTNQLQYHYDKRMFVELKLITNLKIDDIRWKQFCTKYRSLWPKENLLSIRFKRDHKQQKRIQCALNWRRFKMFINKVCI